MSTNLKPLPSYSMSRLRRRLMGSLVVALTAPARWDACSGDSRFAAIRPGALVYVDDYQIGTTPVSTDFVYYGTRKVRLSLSGYETLTVMQPIPTPWYQYPGLDFVSENLVPGEIRDERVVEFQLKPQMIVPSPAIAGTGREPAALGRGAANTAAAAAGRQLRAACRFRASGLRAAGRRSSGPARLAAADHRARRMVWF